MGIFKKKQYGIINMPSVDTNDAPVVPDGAWVKCNHCGKILYKKDLEENYKICPNCNYYFRLGAHERIDLICDKDTFIEFNKCLESKNPLNFPGYNKKLKISKENSKINEAVVTGKGKINGMESIICIMDSSFMMGSMGTVVGEKITFAIEKAINEELPIIIFTASGGARMQEGILSLMHMAKISAALAKHSEKGLLYITVLTDPTTGGVTASFAMLGDIIIADIVPSHLAPVFPYFNEMGCHIYLDKNLMRITAAKRLKRVKKINTLPYPGFPTDSQSPLAAALSVAKGTSVIKETVFENRFRYVGQLNRFGADIEVNDRIAVINGVKKLNAANVEATDLRGGAALVIAALAAEGVSTVDKINYIDRGYEAFENGLGRLGANIKRISNGKENEEEKSAKYYRVCCSE